LNWTGETNKLMFMNLPNKCTLKIYTVTGDLIKTIEHKAGADEAWIDMRTDANQYPSSGVYILYIDDARGFDGDPFPDAIYKFVIVR